MTAPEIHRSKVVLNMITKTGAGIVLGALWLFACSEAPVDIGDENTQKTGESLSDYAGSWSGYAEAFTFEFADNSDRVRLLIDEQGNGSLQVGEGAASVPPIDPDVPPPGPWTSAEWTHSMHQLMGGYRYTLKDLHVEERRLRFTLDALEPVRPWCQAQVPLTVDAAGNPVPVITCRNNVRRDSQSGMCLQWDANQNSVPIECGAYNLCYGSFDCSCNETSCDTALSPTWLLHHYTGDMALNENGLEMVGTLVVEDGDHARPVQLRLKL